MKYSLLSLLVVPLITSSLCSMQQPRQRLSQFNFRGASVLPYTHWPTKPEYYFLLAREVYGNDAGTYDAFGGSREPGEGHPVVTAARELSEESARLLGTKDSLIRHLNHNTCDIIANRHKEFVVYITHFDHTLLERTVRQFAQARNRTNQREKDNLAWVKWNNLSAAIANAQRDQNGRLLPVRVWANVIHLDGTRRAEQITLRPVFVSCMQSFFQGAPYVWGRNQNIRFYQQ